MGRKAGFLVTGVLLLAGCGLFNKTAAPVLTARSIAAPYAGLVNKKVVLVVYAPTAVIDEFPGAREEISDFVATNMREHMAATQLVAPRDVIYWQNDTLNWPNLSPRDIARRFSVDQVVFIEVLDYSMRRPRGVSNLQGRLRAQCRIYDAQTDAAVEENGRMPAAWTGLIDAAWPPTKPLDATQTHEAAVRLRTLESFADLLVRNFYQTRNDSPALRG